MHGSLKLMSDERPARHEWVMYKSEHSYSGALSGLQNFYISLNDPFGNPRGDGCGFRAFSGLYADFR